MKNDSWGMRPAKADLVQSDIYLKMSPAQKWNEFRKVQFNVDGKPKNIANSIDLFYLYFLGEEPLLDVKKRDTYFLLPGERGIYNSRIAKHYWDATPLHIARILTEHYVSPEGIKRLGSLTTYDLTTIPIDILVTDMYNRFYRRNPDPSGQAYWVEQFIQQGLDRDSRLTKWPGVIKNFVHHKELLESHLQLQKPQAFNW